jgi:tRNA(fMet)-specific endonuclease VapC
VTFVLDTNAVSAVMKGDARVLARLRQASRQDVLVPQPVFAEITYGIARLPRSRKKEALQQRFELVKSQLGRAEWTDAVSEAFGAIKAHLERKGTRIEDFDAAIAAHAQAWEATLVTANVAHMARVPGLRVENWGK